MKSSFLSSIKFKLMFFVTLCVSASLLLCGAYFFNKISGVVTQLQVDQLSSEVQLVSPLFAVAFKEMQSDLSVISGTPPIQGIIRSSRNGEVDPKDGSTTELWRTRLESIFKSTLGSRPNYTQIRYIGIADGGREIVRVNNTGGKIEAVAFDALQPKGDEEYFKKGLTLAPGEMYYSAVSLNRENGKIQTPYLPVIRGILPVHDDKGTLFGMLVINTSYGEALSSVFDALQIEKDLYVINEAGDYVLYHKEGDGETTFVFKSLSGEEGLGDSNPVAKILESTAVEGTLFEQVNNQDAVVQYYKDRTVFGDPSRFLAFAIVSSRDSFVAPIQEAEKEAVLIIALSILACVSLALVFSYSVINPLVSMDQKILDYDEDNEEELTGLPVELKDEIGSLARSFTALFHKISIIRKDERSALHLLEESEQQFRSAMEYSPVGKALVSLSGGWLNVNQALCLMSGYSEDELLELDFQTLTHPDDLDADLEQVQQVLSGEIASYRMEKRYIRKDGGLIWGLLSVSLVRDARGEPKHFVSEILDITDIKNTQQRLEEVNTELEEFTYCTSHDLRSPLTSSIGLLKLTEDALENDDAESAKKSISFASSSLKKLEVLLLDILELGRIKHASEELQDVDVQQLVDDSLEKFAHMENFERLDVQVDLKYKEKVYTKSTRLRMIVENLISNAIKYQDVDKKKSYMKIESANVDGDFVFAVEDNGVGIPEDQRENMFVMFKRFHPKTSFGSGLGLYMMKKSADIIGAYIRYADIENGSRFELVMPIEEANASVLDDAHHAGASGA